jgi:hypothetical protein
MSSLPPHLQAKLGQLVEDATLPPTPTEAKAKKRKPTRTKEQAFAALDILTREAKAGAQNDFLADTAQVSLHFVFLWRKERNIPSPIGRSRSETMNSAAVDLFGDDPPEVMHPTLSPVGGVFTPPEYVLRTPLRYGELCRLVHFLHTRQGTDAVLIAEALGLRERDVRYALLLESAHLDRVGMPCPKCGLLTDPAYGPTCSKTCRNAT